MKEHTASRFLLQFARIIFQDLLSSFFAFFRGRIFEMNLTGTIRGAEVGPIDIAQRLSTPLEIRSFGVQTDQFI